MDGSGIYPPNVKPAYRGTILSWYGVSSEEVTCGNIDVKGLNLLPTTRNETEYIIENGQTVINNAYHWGRDDLVLGSNGDGT